MPESKIQRSGSLDGDSNSSGSSSSSDDESEEVVDIVWDFCRQSDLGDTLESFVTRNLEQLEDLRPLSEEQNHTHVEGIFLFFSFSCLYFTTQLKSTD